MISWLISILFGLVGVGILLFLFWRDSKKGNFTHCKGRELCKKCTGTGRNRNRLLPGLMPDDICSKCNGTGIDRKLGSHQGRR